MSTCSWSPILRAALSETHLPQLGQRLPGLMRTELGVHHALGLLLDEKLFGATGSMTTWLVSR